MLLETLVATVAVFALAMLALGVGRLTGRPPLRGSCGGAGGQCACGAAPGKACRAPEDEDRGDGGT